MSFLTSIKEFIFNLAKLTSNQVAILVLILSDKLLSYGSFFIAFYFIFQYDADKTFFSNMPQMIFIGLVVGLWFAIIDILRLQMKKSEKDVKKISAWIIRGIFTNRYIILFGAIYYLFTVRFTPGQVWLYLGIILSSRLLAKFLQSLMLRLQELDWSVLDDRK